MIVIAYKPGQLANRLFLFAKFIAYSYEHHVSVINPSFDDYATYFEKTKHQFIPASGQSYGYAFKVLIKFVYHFCYYLSRILHRIKVKQDFLSITYLDWTEQYDLDSDKKLIKSGLHFIQGWGYCAPELLRLHRLKIVDFFRPSQFLQKEIDIFFQRFDNSHCLVGVHIRHGDYRHFESGKYFYELDAYKAIMKQLAVNCSNVRFLVCTNNKEIVSADFGNLDVILAPGHELIDLYLLTKCNYIMGPPSTYSLWASFYGSVPLYQIKDINRSIDWSNFELME